MGEYGGGWTRILGGSLGGYGRHGRGDRVELWVGVKLPYLRGVEECGGAGGVDGVGGRMQQGGAGRRYRMHVCAWDGDA